ncbi:MAG: phosphoethanolamine transferase [Phascolarctobacterium sp.]|uniref:phosphoethanolamine transferase n=1 Tax=Phascolarctobacterium sp. TaxID=2049039 RepID=UPI0026DD665E|nr:phosphoethanolamine transferase [Phascolarctobacterium sp.]MDO4920616.1 phosphoethanolamine transferase [Phascolarctobacterium sp.]
MKKDFFRIVIYSAVLFCLLFGYYVLTSNGLGNKPFYLQLRRFIPMSIICVITVRLLLAQVSRKFFISFAITSAAWMLAYPVLYKLTFTKTVPFFSHHFDIVFAIYSFVGLTALTFLALRKNLSKIARLILSVLQTSLLLLPLLEVAYFFYYGNCITEAAVLSIYQTNPAEAKEYILQSLGYGGVLAAALGIDVIFTGLYRVNGNHLHLITAAQPAKKSLIFLSVAALAATIYSFGNAFPQTGIMTLNSDVRRYFYAVNEFNVLHKQTLKDLRVSPSEPAFAKPSTVIVVIGECASRNFMSAYTATPTDTTPWLRRQKANPDFIVFKNAYSTRVNTVMALERALTEKNQYNDLEFKQSATIIDIAKGAGYYTSWFSNQGTTDVSDTPITIVGKTADVAKWTNQDLSTVQYDGALLNYLKAVDPQKNNFIVLHLMGSHDNYQNRYPPEFAKWGDPSKNEPPLNYDNSLYYSDYVLSQIYQYAKDNLNLQAMLYFSDHGTVPNGRRNPDMNPFAALRIPMFVYLSPEYQQQYPATTAALKKHQAQYFTNDLIYEMVCGLLNVESNRYDETQSFASPKYKYTRETLRTDLGKVKLTDDKE